MKTLQIRQLNFLNNIIVYKVTNIRNLYTSQVYALASVKTSIVILEFNFILIYSLLMLKKVRHIIIEGIFKF